MTKKELTDLILDKENQLFRAKKESECWNKGKYKKSSNADISKIFVNSLQKEISDLMLKLSAL